MVGGRDFLWKFVDSFGGMLYCVAIMIALSHGVVSVFGYD